MPLKYSRRSPRNPPLWPTIALAAAVAFTVGNVLVTLRALSKLNELLPASMAKEYSASPDIEIYVVLTSAFSMGWR